jgi:hypothetical protein
MHAWAEVNHDLAYKPTTGELSTEEYAILDELNGLVLTGEIALERLQRAVDERISRQRAPFRNHYELADYLHDFVRSRDPGQKDEPRMGRADVLLRFLELAGLNSLEELARFLEEVSFDGNEANRGPGDRRDSGE